MSATKKLCLTEMPFSLRITVFMPKIGMGVLFAAIRLILSHLIKFFKSVLDKRMTLQSAPVSIKNL